MASELEVEAPAPEFTLSQKHDRIMENTKEDEQGKNDVRVSEGYKANTNGECFLYPPSVEKIVSEHNSTLSESFAKGEDQAEPTKLESTHQQYGIKSEKVEQVKEEITGKANPNVDGKEILNEEHIQSAKEENGEDGKEEISPVETATAVIDSDQLQISNNISNEKEADISPPPESTEFVAEKRSLEEAEQDTELEKPSNSSFEETSDNGTIEEDENTQCDKLNGDNMTEADVKEITGILNSDVSQNENDSSIGNDSVKEDKEIQDLSYKIETIEDKEENVLLSEEKAHEEQASEVSRDFTPSEEASVKDIDMAAEVKDQNCAEPLEPEQEKTQEGKNSEELMESDMETNTLKSDPQKSEVASDEKELNGDVPAEVNIYQQTEVETIQQSLPGSSPEVNESIHNDHTEENTNSIDYAIEKEGNDSTLTEHNIHEKKKEKDSADRESVDHVRETEVSNLQEETIQNMAEESAIEESSEGVKDETGETMSPEKDNFDLTGIPEDSTTEADVKENFGILESDPSEDENDSSLIDSVGKKDENREPSSNIETIEEDEQERAILPEERNQNELAAEVGESKEFTPSVGNADGETAGNDIDFAAAEQVEKESAEPSEAEPEKTQEKNDSEELKETDMEMKASETDLQKSEAASDEKEQLDEHFPVEVNINQETGAETIQESFPGSNPEVNESMYYDDKEPSREETSDSRDFQIEQEGNESTRSEEPKHEKDNLKDSAARESADDVCEIEVRCLQEETNQNMAEDSAIEEIPERAKDQTEEISPEKEEFGTAGIPEDDTTEVDVKNIGEVLESELSNEKNNSSLSNDSLENEDENLEPSSKIETIEEDKQERAVSTEERNQNEQKAEVTENREITTSEGNDNEEATAKVIDSAIGETEEEKCTDCLEPNPEGGGKRNNSEELMETDLEMKASESDLQESGAASDGKDSNEDVPAEVNIHEQTGAETIQQRFPGSEPEVNEPIQTDEKENCNEAISKGFPIEKEGDESTLSEEHKHEENDIPDSATRDLADPSGDRELTIVHQDIDENMAQDNAIEETVEGVQDETEELSPGKIEKVEESTSQETTATEPSTENLCLDETLGSSTQESEVSPIENTTDLTSRPEPAEIDSGHQELKLNENSQIRSTEIDGQVDQAPFLNDAEGKPSQTLDMCNDEKNGAVSTRSLEMNTEAVKEEVDLNSIEISENRTVNNTEEEDVTGQQNRDEPHNLEKPESEETEDINEKKPDVEENSVVELTDESLTRSKQITEESVEHAEAESAERAKEDNACDSQSIELAEEEATAASSEEDIAAEVNVQSNMELSTPCTHTEEKEIILERDAHHVESSSQSDLSEGNSAEITTTEAKHTATDQEHKDAIHTSHANSTEENPEPVDAVEELDSESTAACDDSLASATADESKHVEEQDAPPTEDMVFERNDEDQGVSLPEKDYDLDAEGSIIKAEDADHEAHEVENKENQAVQQEATEEEIQNVVETPATEEPEKSNTTNEYSFQQHEQKNTTEPETAEIQRAEEEANECSTSNEIQATDSVQDEEKVNCEFEDTNSNNSVGNERAIEAPQVQEGDSDVNNDETQLIGVQEEKTIDKQLENAEENYPKNITSAISAEQNPEPVDAAEKLEVVTEPAATDDNTITSEEADKYVTEGSSKVVECENVKYDEHVLQEEHINDQDLSAAEIEIELQDKELQLDEDNQSIRKEANENLQEVSDDKEKHEAANVDTHQQHDQSNTAELDNSEVQKNGKAHEQSETEEIQGKDEVRHEKSVDERFEETSNEEANQQSIEASPRHDEYTNTVKDGDQVIKVQEGAAIKEQHENLEDEDPIIDNESAEENPKPVDAVEQLDSKSATAYNDSLTSFETEEIRDVKEHDAKSHEHLLLEGQNHNQAQSVTLMDNGLDDECSENKSQDADQEKIEELDPSQKLDESTTTESEKIEFTKEGEEHQTSGSPMTCGTDTVKDDEIMKQDSNSGNEIGNEETVASPSQGEQLEEIEDQNSSNTAECVSIEENPKPAEDVEELNCCPKSAAANDDIITSYEANKSAEYEIQNKPNAYQGLSAPGAGNQLEDEQSTGNMEDANQEAEDLELNDETRSITKDATDEYLQQVANDEVGIASDHNSRSMDYQQAQSDKFLLQEGRKEEEDSMNEGADAKEVAKELDLSTETERVRNEPAKEGFQQATDDKAKIINRNVESPQQPAESNVAEIENPEAQRDENAQEQSEANEIHGKGEVSDEEIMIQKSEERNNGEQIQDHVEASTARTAAESPVPSQDKCNIFNEGIQGVEVQEEATTESQDHRTQNDNLQDEDPIKSIHNVSEVENERNASTSVYVQVQEEEKENKIYNFREIDGSNFDKEKEFVNHGFVTEDTSNDVPDQQSATDVEASAQTGDEKDAHSQDECPDISRDQEQVAEVIEPKARADCQALAFEGPDSIHSISAKEVKHVDTLSSENKTEPVENEARDDSNKEQDAAVPEMTSEEYTVSDEAKSSEHVLAPEFSIPRETITEEEKQRVDFGEVELNVTNMTKAEEETSSPEERKEGSVLKILGDNSSEETRQEDEDDANGVPRKIELENPIAGRIKREDEYEDVASTEDDANQSVRQQELEDTPHPQGSEMVSNINCDAAEPITTEEDQLQQPSSEQLEMEHEDTSAVEDKMESIIDVLIPKEHMSEDNLLEKPTEEAESEPKVSTSDFEPTEDSKLKQELVEEAGKTDESSITDPLDLSSQSQGANVPSEIVAERDIDNFSQSIINENQVQLSNKLEQAADVSIPNDSFSEDQEQSESSEQVLKPHGQELTKPEETLEDHNAVINELIPEENQSQMNNDANDANDATIYGTKREENFGLADPLKKLEGSSELEVASKTITEVEKDNEETNDEMAGHEANSAKNQYEKDTITIIDKKQTNFEFSVGKTGEINQAIEGPSIDEKTDGCEQEIIKEDSKQATTGEQNEEICMPTEVDVSGQEDVLVQAEEKNISEPENIDTEKDAISQGLEEDNSSIKEDNRQSDPGEEASRLQNNILNQDESVEISRNIIEAVEVKDMTAIQTQHPSLLNKVLTEEEKYMYEPIPTDNTATVSSEEHGSNASNAKDTQEKQAPEKDSGKTDSILTPEPDSSEENLEEEEKQMVACENNMLSTENIGMIALVKEEPSSEETHQQADVETPEVEEQAAKEAKETISSPQLEHQTRHMAFAEDNANKLAEIQHVVDIEGGLTIPNKKCSSTNYQDVDEVTAADIIASQIARAIEEEEQRQQQTSEELKNDNASDDDVTKEEDKSDNSLEEATKQTYLPEAREKELELQKDWQPKQETEEKIEEKDYVEMPEGKDLPSVSHNETSKGSETEIQNEKEIKDSNKLVSSQVDKISQSQMTHDQENQANPWPATTNNDKQSPSLKKVPEIHGEEHMKSDEIGHHKTVSSELTAAEKTVLTSEAHLTTFSDAGTEQAADLKDIHHDRQGQVEEETIARSLEADEKPSTMTKILAKKLQTSQQTTESPDKAEKTITKDEGERTMEFNNSLFTGQKEAAFRGKVSSLDIPKTEATILLPKTPEVAEEKKAKILADDSDSPADAITVTDGIILEKCAISTYEEPCQLSMKNQQASSQGIQEDRVHVQDGKNKESPEIQQIENITKLENPDIPCQFGVDTMVASINKRRTEDTSKGAYEQVNQIGSFPSQVTAITESKGNKVATLQQREPLKESLQIEEADESSAGSHTIETKSRSVPMDTGRITTQTSQTGGHTEKGEQANNKEEKPDGGEAMAEEQKTDVEKDESTDQSYEDLERELPITAEAMREMELKATQKKSHNILLGVGSKVKQSISKMKKAIACSSAQFSQEDVIIKFNKNKKA